MPNEGLIQGISRNEVNVAISRMNKGNTTGMGGMTVQAWTCLEEEGIGIL